MTDNQITGLFFQRSEKAIHHATEKYGNLILRIAGNILGNSDDSEEVLNDVLCRLWNVIPPESPENLKAFCARLSRNTAINRLAQRKAQKRGGNLTQIDSEWLEILPDSGDFTSEVALKDVFDRFLETLGEENRKIFVRRYFFMDSVEDIADIYRISQSKVKSSLFRTRNALREYLMKEGIEV